MLVSPVEDKGMVNIWIVSDRRTDTPAHLTARLLDFSGHELARREQDVAIAANASRLYLSFARKEILGAADPKKVMLVVELGDKGKPLARNILWFEKTKELDLPRPEIRLEISPVENGAFAIKMTAARLARDVYLTAGVDGFFDDNYLDLLPGETVAVTFTPAPGAGAGVTAESLQASLRATTIADTYP